ncbi:MAG: PH domain-containing protein [Halobacteriota archaeon]
MSAKQSLPDADVEAAEQQDPTSGETEFETDTHRLPVETRPTIRPVLVWMAIVISMGVGAIALVFSKADAVGGPELAKILIQAVGILTLLVVLRLAIRAVILRRTTYTITNDTVRRQYTLLLRTRVREVPADVIRSSELRQSRIQRFLGYGTLAVNEGLGEIDLEHVPDPQAIRGALRDVIDTRSDTTL